MQTGNADRSGELESNRYKEAGTLISICTPPIIDKTIAEVFLHLLAVSVKEFFAWHLLPGLLLLLPRAISDVFSFGRCAMCRSEMPLARRAALCKRCISISNAESLLPAEKEVLYLDKYISLVLARKGKNKGRQSDNKL